MFAKFLSSLLVMVSSLFGSHQPATTTPPITAEAVMVREDVGEIAKGDEASSTKPAEKNPEMPGRANPVAEEKARSNMPSALSESDLLALAGPVPATLALGDGKYTTDAAKKGYIYFCHVPQGNGGGADGGKQTWIHGSTWSPPEKTVYVHGSVSWPNAKFSNTVSGSTRTLEGNGLPISHTTGAFPVSSSDPAYSYDRNPNSISAQTLKDVLPANPAYSDMPNCMEMESGVMLSGIPIFAAFDAELRDAVAYEVQDSCDGHPEKDGQYHYHGLSSCFTDTSVSTVLGYALDGFPITGPKVAEGKYLTTDDLDVCHGLTSEVVVDGKKTTTYHYVMTADFPYSVSCFRGKPVSYSALNQGQAGTQPGGSQIGGGSNMPQQGPGRMPPQEAVQACSGKSSGSSCSFTTPNGTITGTCKNTPDGSVACVPEGR